MTDPKTPHEWSKDSLLAKSQRFATLMLEKDREDWRFGFWSTLTLEMLVRASFSNISPTLVADGKEWNNILYALGKEPNVKRYIPKSVGISDLLGHAGSIFPDFTPELSTFAKMHINRRNSELHSGELPFDDLGTSTWLPLSYVHL